MIQLPLTQGFTAIIDDRDYAHLAVYKWQYDCGYASRRYRDLKTNKHVKVYLHRAIMDLREGFVVDHINGNKLDNRRVNLRVCTQKINMTNTVRHRQGLVKGYEKLPGGKYRAKIRVDGKLSISGVSTPVN